MQAIQDLKKEGDEAKNKLLKVKKLKNNIIKLRNKLKEKNEQVKRETENKDIFK